MNVPARPDQVPGTPSPGAIAPGQSGLIVARTVIIFGSSGGLFVYSPTPASGNLVASITAQGGTDAYGNQYQAGITVYGSSQEANLNAGELEFFASPPTAGENALMAFITGSLGGFSLSSFGAREQATNGNLRALADLLSSTGSGIDGQFNVYGWAPLTSAVEACDVNVSGVINAIITGTSPSVETWHSLGDPTMTDWTFERGNYRLSPLGGTEFDIEFRSTASTGGATGTFANTMPALYRPTLIRTFAVGMDNTITAVGNNWPSLIVNTTGVVQIQLPPSGAAGTHAGVQCICYP